MEQLAATRYAPLAADVISWGYAVIAAVVVLNSNATYTVVDAVLIAGLFLVLRSVARQVRAEANRNARQVRRGA